MRQLLSSHAAKIRMLTYGLLACSNLALVQANAQSTLAKPGRYAISRIAAEPYDAAHVRCAETIGGQTALQALVNDVAPVLAQHPTQPLSLALVWQTPYSVQFSASSDGGFSWRKPITMKLGGCAGGPSVDNLLSDAKVAIGADGAITVAALLSEPERQIERLGEDGEIELIVEPESTAVVVARSTDNGVRFANAVLIDSQLASAASKLTHLALSAHPTRAGRAYLLATRDSDQPDGFGVRVARAPLFAAASGGVFETLRELAELRPRDQFQWGAAHLAVDAVKEQLILVGALRDTAPRLLNPLLATRADFLQISTASTVGTIGTPMKFSAARTVASLLPLKLGASVSVGSAQIPVNPGIDALSLALDAPRGRYYIGYSDTRGADASNLTISLVASGDAGLTWSAPKLIEGRKGQAFWRPSVVVDSSGALAISMMRGRASSTQPAAGFRVESYLTRYQVLSDLSIERESSELFDQYTYKTDRDAQGFSTPVAWPLLALPQRCVLPIVQRHIDRADAPQQIDLAVAIFANSVQSCL